MPNLVEPKVPFVLRMWLVSGFAVQPLTTLRSIGVRPLRPMAWKDLQTTVLRTKEGGCSRA